jgi:hypothetical protein
VRKPSEGTVAIGGLIVFAVWLFVALPFLIIPNQTPGRDQTTNKCSAEQSKNHGFWEKTDCDPVAYFTLWLVGFTGVLAVSTIGLWIVTWRSGVRQTRDTEILQRAYISAIPMGIEPYKTTMGRFGANVAFHNVGNLPATEVSWFVCRRFSRKDNPTHFPTPEKRLEGNNIIPPKTQALKGSRGISSVRLVKFKQGMDWRNRFLYVWGMVKYKDGFGKTRFTKFCHRYNVAAEVDLRINASDARYHEYGNDGD